MRPLGLPCYVILYSTLLYSTLLCYAMLCYAMLCYAMLCYAMLCYAMLCYAMLCYAMLCYAMLCYGTLRHCSVGAAPRRFHLPEEPFRALGRDPNLPPELSRPVCLCVCVYI